MEPLRVLHSVGVTLFALLIIWPVAKAQNKDSPAASATSLNGSWNFSIHGRGRKTVEVPSTYLPVGDATLEREFEVAPTEKRVRAILHFDGLAAAAGIWVNDKKAGGTGPYVAFQADITDLIHVGSNSIRVEMNDLDGPKPWTRDWIPAFPRFGGIVRAAYIEWKPATYIETARLEYKLTDNYSRAECKLHLWIVNTGKESEALNVTAQIGTADRSRRAESEIRAQPGESEQLLELDVPQVSLWSPDSPTLYQLRVDIGRAGVIGDRYSTETGFREFIARGQDFFLNGQKFFVKGIFRHDMYGDQGHTLTPAQMEADIADIKSLGANFVRLGHYPHDKRIVELAARHGLMVSEEPPIFALPQTDPLVLQAAKDCLGKTVRRDWNNPAVVIWFLSNEVGTNIGYMKEMSAYVRGLDPSRLVGIVDNTKWTAANAPWADFRAAKIDFIAQNAYGSGLDGSYDKLSEILPTDMPYMISEWGGTSNDYEAVMREGEFYLAHSTMRRDSGPRIAGISFWEYADINCARWSAGGVLHWSITDKFRVPYETYYALKTLYTGRVYVPPVGRRLPNGAVETIPRKMAAFESTTGYEPIDLAPIVNSDAVLADVKPVSALSYPQDLPLGRVIAAGLPFDLNRQVILLGKNHTEVRVPIGKPAQEIIFLGHVCFNGLNKAPAAGPPELPFLTELGQQAEFPPPFKGYPFAGRFGETLAEYVIHYQDGKQENTPLQNGIHFADYRAFFGFSFIEPVATDTEEALLYGGDFGTKRYQLRIFSYRPLRPSQKIAFIDFRLRDPEYMPILAAITVKQ